MKIKEMEQMINKWLKLNHSPHFLFFLRLAKMLTLFSSLRIIIIIIDIIVNKTL